MKFVVSRNQEKNADVFPWTIREYEGDEHKLQLCKNLKMTDVDFANSTFDKGFGNYVVAFSSKVESFDSLDLMNEAGRELYRDAVLTVDEIASESKPVAGCEVIWLGEDLSVSVSQVSYQVR